MLAVQYDTPEWSLPVEPTCSDIRLDPDGEERRCSQRTGQSWEWCLGCRRKRAVERIRGWLRSDDWPSVLSLTNYDVAGTAGHPDRKWDRIAMDADLRRVFHALPPLERAAGQISKATKPAHLSWADWVAREMVIRAGAGLWGEWLEWMNRRRLPAAVDPQTGKRSKNQDMADVFYPLVDRAANLMADALSEMWW